MDKKPISGKCEKKCSGAVLRVADKCFHKTCFQCCLCEKSLVTAGYFVKDNAYYCIADYQRLYGTKCNACKQASAEEGQLVHQKTCLTCSKCHQPAQSDGRAVNTSKEVLCGSCASGNRPSQARESFVSPQAQDVSLIPDQRMPMLRGTAIAQRQKSSVLKKCAGCNEILDGDQALVALDRHWHVWCFRCKACNAVLNDNYVDENGVPYCEKCYQRSFGAKCTICNHFIKSKGLKAGNNFRLHLWCARCTKCGDSLGDGADVHVLGSAIWHPHCDPKHSQSELIINTKMTLNDCFTDFDCDSVGSGARSLSGLPYSYHRIPHRAVSSGLILREYGRLENQELSQIHSQSYTTKASGHLRNPIDASNSTPLSIYFQRQPSNGRIVAGQPSARSNSISESVDLQPETPHAKSPITNNGQPNDSIHPSEMEALDSERKQQYSDDIKGVSVPTENDDIGFISDREVPKRIQRNVDVLKKLKSGIGAAIAKDLMQQAKYTIWKKDLEVRNASRLPSARRDSKYKLSRNSLSVSSSSLNFAHAKSIFEDGLLDRSISNGGAPGSVPSARTLPKHQSTPSFQRKEYSLGHFGALGDKTNRTDLSRGESDASINTITESEGCNSTGAHLSTISEVIYPYHLLVTTNYRLPTDVERCNLERHLSEVDFEHVFACNRSQFYRLPLWRRNVLKRQVKLF